MSQSPPAPAGERVEFDRSIQQAVGGYQPQPYRGRAVLFFAQESGRTSFLFPSAGWGRWMSGPVDVHVLPGSTAELLVEPNVEILAETFQGYLDRLSNWRDVKPVESEPST